MGARTGEAVEQTAGRIEREIGSTAKARQLAEDHGQPEIAAFLRTATDCGLDDLNEARSR
ncbi:hypothetical protein J7F02_34615 [Streptomyces sp. ISL-112]|uniref:hypothetical protein n=1 Tax=unclassified Streptomyces TaxID=2593676 RepID=UPI001BE8FEDB|nr:MULTISPECIES: hypothetical protein [unclassified Streptomyces]MBT2430571.1 hypothetical protein [Streptomyces sp. ISL-112]MBT2465841.1 hypothetical protein [Streptomyces sp. ISL-63]